MDWEREKQEAIDAGYAAMDALEEARDNLSSARNWGLADMFFRGGLISGMIKHSKMNDADYCIKKAQAALQKFNNELNDLDLMGINVDTGDFLGFADIFFDGFITDFLMQNRIRDAQDQIDNAIARIQQILDRIEEM